MERKTGFEPATNSLEGCDSTPELLPHFVKYGDPEVAQRLSWSGAAERSRQSKLNRILDTRRPYSIWRPQLDLNQHDPVTVPRFRKPGRYEGM